MRTYTILDSDGREWPLHHYNPVSVIPRPKVSPYGRARYLSVEQARAFLRAIPRTYPQGLRDYALFLGYMITGRRNSEIRTLRWGDFEKKGEKVYYQWEGKGKQRRDECPQSFWNAILVYLRAADRLDTITPENFIFTALTNNADRLPGVQNPHSTSFAEQNYQAIAKQQPDSRHPRPPSPVPSPSSSFPRPPSSVPGPLTSRFISRLVKRYAYKAGLDPKRVSVHTLRHTAAMLRKEAGQDIETISRFLNHSSLSVTQIYLHHIEGAQDTGWRKVEELLGLNGDNR